MGIDHVLEIAWDIHTKIYSLNGYLGSFGDDIYVSPTTPQILFSVLEETTSASVLYYFTIGCMVPSRDHWISHLYGMFMYKIH